MMRTVGTASNVVPNKLSTILVGALEHEGDNPTKYDNPRTSPGPISPWSSSSRR